MSTHHRSEGRGRRVFLGQADDLIYLDRWLAPIDLRQSHGEIAASEYARLKAIEFGVVAVNAALNQETVKASTDKPPRS